VRRQALPLGDDEVEARAIATPPICEEREPPGAVARGSTAVSPCTKRTASKGMPSCSCSTCA
jgi:hypothetical protein